MYCSQETPRRMWLADCRGRDATVSSCCTIVVIWLLLHMRMLAGTVSELKVYHKCKPCMYGINDKHSCTLCFINRMCCIDIVGCLVDFVVDAACCIVVCIGCH